MMLWSLGALLLILSYSDDAIVKGFGLAIPRHTLLSRSPSTPFTFRTKNRLLKSSQSKSTRLYYFDDISRYSLDDTNQDILYDGTNNDGNNVDDNCNTVLPNAMSKASLHQQLQAQFHKDKQDALRRLLGYCNSDSAATLTKKEIKVLTKEWAKKSNIYHHSVFTKIRMSPHETATSKTTSNTGLPTTTTTTSIKVCSSSTMIGCLAYYWKTIHHQTQKKNKNQDIIDKNNDAMLIVFPYCNDLYVYETLSLLNAAICLGNTGHVLSLYHPKYKNAPSIFSPERHSPFPTLGIGRWLQESRLQNQQQQHVFTFGGLPEQQQSSFVLPLDDSVYLDQQRLKLERLYNSAAATTTQMFIPADELIQECQTWYTKHHAQKHQRQQQLNREQQQQVNAPSQDQYTGKKMTQHDDDSITWLVSPAIIPEEAYAHVFAAIHNTTARTKKAFTTTKHTASSTGRTIMILMPRYCPHNAPQWRQFCITINAILKRLHGNSTNNRKMTSKISIQNVFHPEWTDVMDTTKDGRHNDDDDERQRAPCSILQIRFSGTDG